jgi:hypothetical protein
MQGEENWPPAVHATSVLAIVKSDRAACQHLQPRPMENDDAAAPPPDPSVGKAPEFRTSPFLATLPADIAGLAAAGAGAKLRRVASGVDPVPWTGSGR